MADRDDVIARIMALRARARDAGSSEAEVEASARIAARIIAEHNVTEDELRERGTDGIGEALHNKGRSEAHPALKACAFQIGQLTQTMGLYAGGQHKFVGQPEDVAFAVYLCELVQGASERAYKAHRAETDANPILRPSAKSRAARRSYRTHFLFSFGGAVAIRMNRMVRERKEARHSATGTDLVVVKSELIQSYLDEKYPWLKDDKGKGPIAPKPKRMADFFAGAAGRAAGEDLNLNRPLDDDTDKPSAALR